MRPGRRDDRRAPAAGCVSTSPRWRSAGCRSRSSTCRERRTARRSSCCTRGWARWRCGASSRPSSRPPPGGGWSPSRATGTGARRRRRGARTPAFFHEEALEVLPELLAALEVSDPVLIGHSDGASIGLIHAAHHPVTALALLAPHVFVEDICVTAIRGTRETFVHGELRERMARHHDDPDAAFWGWCDVWLDPAFAQWSLEKEASMLQAPTLLIQGAEDPVRDAGPDRPDRGPRPRAGAAARARRRSQPASGARTGGRAGHRRLPGSQVDTEPGGAAAGAGALPPCLATERG